MRDRTHLEKLSRALTSVHTQVTSLIAAGASLDEVRQRGDWKSVRAIFVPDEDGWGRRLFSNVFLGAIVSNAYKEAKGEAIVQGRDGG